MITQRPSELSDTCVSQCMNFVILRTLHPTDLKYIREMVPNVSSEIVLQLKNLKPGNCIAFGSAFQVPTSMYIDLPNPRPLSNNVDLKTVWYKQPKNNLMEESLMNPAGANTGISMGGNTPQIQTMPFNPNLNSNVVQTIQPQQVASVVSAPTAQTTQPVQPQMTDAQNKFIQPQNATVV